MAGDFNTSMTLKDKYIDKEPMGPGHPKVVAFLQDFLESANMLDIWRIRHPEDRRFTWSITKPKCLMERLDYIFISANLSSAVILTDIDPKFCSDHAIPYLVINDEAVNNKGPGYWKLNTTHLEENEYKELIKTIIEGTTKVKASKHTKQNWEVMKMMIRGETIKYGACKKKARDNLLEVLQNKLYQMTVDSEQKIPKQPV